MESLDDNSIGRMQILPIHERWKLLAIGTILSLVANLAGIIKVMKVNDLIDRIKGGDSGAAYEVLRMSKSVDPIAAIGAIVGIMAIVFVCMWFYRAGQNIHMAGMKYLNYSPGWYVGWFFIPLVQLVMPFITTIELWKASASINKPDEYSSWSSNKLSMLVTVWYSSFIVMIVVALYMGFSNFEVARRMAFDPDAAVEYFGNMNKIAFVTIPLQTISGICLILFSKKISENQTQYLNAE